MNCTPLSDVMILGTPKPAIHPLVSAEVQSAVVVFFSRIASGHPVVLPTIVNRCVKLSLDVGSGPTRSTSRWENLLEGVVNACTGVCTCLCTLPRAQPWQSQHQDATSVAILGQTNLPEINLLGARMPGWAGACTAEKIAGFHNVGTSGLGTPVLISQSKLVHSVCTFSTFNELLSSTFCTSRHMSWARASSAKSRWRLMTEDPVKVELRLMMLKMMIFYTALLGWLVVVITCQPPRSGRLARVSGPM